MTEFKIALIGECMIELQETEPGVTQQTFGGDTLNTAIYCSRIGKGLPVQVDYVTALGTDAFSTRMIDFWQQEGVGSDLLQRQDGELPGLYYIEVDENGERVFYYWRDRAAAKKCFEYPGAGQVLDKLADYNAIYLSGISLAILTEKSRSVLISRLKELNDSGVAIYFDCNFRPHLWKSTPEARVVYEQMYPLSHIVFLTTEEADVLLNGVQGDSIHDSLKAKGVKESVVKDGEGICSVLADDRLHKIPAQKVEKIVDTTAAGDSFSAAYLLSRWFGCSAEKAAEIAHKTAAYVISYKGAIAPIDKMAVGGEDILRNCK